MIYVILENVSFIELAPPKNAKWVGGKYYVCYYIIPITVWGLLVAWAQFEK